MAYELTRVLRGLALNRRPGWNFPGNFLDLSFDEVGGAGARLSLEPGPHCLDGEGQVDLGTLGVFADVGMAAGMRQQVGLATRMATVAMSLSLTGALRKGRLESVGVFDGFVAGGAGRQGLARTEIFAGDTLVATGNATFAALGPGWQLVATSAWYLAPGTGLMLRAEANVVHRGGLTAVVRSRILDGQGRTVLEALTQHSRRAAAVED